MAKNLIFGFGARDNGLKKAITGLTDGFKSFGKEMLSLSRFQTMLSALSFDKLDQMADKLKTLGTAGMELTSGWEADFKANQVATSKLGAQWGLTAAEGQKFAQQSFAMSKSIGVSTDVANEALIGMKWASDTTKDAFKKFGIESVEDLAKFSTQTGLSAKDFAYSLSQMEKSLGLNSEQMAIMAGEALKLGQESGDVPGALKSIATMSEKLRAKKSFLLSQGMNAEEAAAKIADMSSQTLALGRALQAGGVLDGLATATGIFDKMNESSEGFSSLLSGKAGDLPDLFKDLAAAGIPIDKAFESMKQGPLEFSQGIAKIVEQLGGDTARVNKTMEYFRKVMEPSLGAEAAAQMADSFRDAKKRAEFLGISVAKTSDEAKKLAGEIKKSYIDPRTDMQKFQDQQAAFMQRFRSMGTMTTGAFLAETRKSFTAFGNMMTSAATDPNKGFLSVVLNKMADVQKFGAAGLFPPDMQGPLVALGSTAEALASPLAKLRAAGINILSPFGLLTAAVAGLGASFLALKAKGKTTDEAFAIIGTRVLKFLQNDLPTYAAKASKFVADFARKFISNGFKFGTTGLTGNAVVDNILNQLVATLKSVFKKALKFVEELFGGLWDGIQGRVVDPATASDGAVIGNAIGGALKAAYDWLAPKVKRFFGGLWDGITQTAIVNPATASDETKIGHAVGDALRKAFDFAAGLVSTWASAWWGRVTNNLMNGDFKKAFGEFIPVAIAALFIAPGAVMAVSGGIFKLMYLAAATLVEAGAVPLIFNAIGSFFLAIGSFLLNAIGSFFLAIGSFLLTAAGVVLIALAAFFAAMFYMFSEEGDTLGETWERMWAAIFTTIEWYADYIGESMKLLWDTLSTAAYNGAAQASLIFDTFLWNVKGAFYEFRNTLADVFNGLIDLMTTPLKTALNLVGVLLGSFADKLAGNPTIAKLLGLDENSVKAMQQAAKLLQDSKMLDAVVDAGKAGKVDVLKETGAKPQMAVDLLKYRDFAERESLDSRQRKAFAPIEEAKQRRLAAADAATKPPALAAPTPIPPMAPLASYATTPIPPMAPLASYAPTPVGAVATDMQFSSLNGFEAGALAARSNAEARRTMPSGLTAATDSAQASNQLQDQLNQSLISAINTPAWVGPYMQMVNQNHKALLAALASPTRAPVSSPANTGAAAAARKPKPIGAAPAPAKSTP